MKPEVNWHARFTQQAGWTSSLRSYLYKSVDMKNASRVLEVGCGTGAILSDLPTFTEASIFGLDLEHSRLIEASGHVPSAKFVNGNALTLPFPTLLFDVCFCISCCYGLEIRSR